MVVNEHLLCVVKMEYGGFKQWWLSLETIYKIISYFLVGFFFCSSFCFFQEPSLSPSFFQQFFSTLLFSIPSPNLDKNGEVKEKKLLKECKNQSINHTPNGGVEEILSSLETCPIKNKRYFLFPQFRLNESKCERIQMKMFALTWLFLRNANPFSYKRFCMTPSFETVARGNCILGAKESGKYANSAKLALTTVFVDTRLWKTKHSRKRFQKFPSIIRVIDMSDRNPPHSH